MAFFCGVTNAIAKEELTPRTMPVAAHLFHRSVERKAGLAAATFHVLGRWMAGSSLPWISPGHFDSAVRLRRLILLCSAVLAAFWLQRASARIAISELLWAGSDLSTADEWVELMGLGIGLGSGAEVGADDLSGWVLTTRDSSGEEVPIVRFTTGTTLAPGAFLLVGNYDAEHSRLAWNPAVVTTAVSLPNTKLQLRLYDVSGVLMDVADDGIGVPMAGMNASGTGYFASMERIRFDLPGDDPAAWQTARTSIGFDDGAPVLGTPGFPNGEGEGGGGTGWGSESSHSSNSSQSLALSSVEVSYSSQSLHSSQSFLSSLLSSEASAKEDASFSSFTSFDFLSSFGSSDSSYSSESSLSSSSSPNPNPNPIPQIRLTEVLANPIGADDEEWIEIGNGGTGAVSIAGWTLRDGSASGRFDVPSVRTATGAYPPKAATGFILDPGEHISFRKSVSGLALGNDGEQLSLWSGALLIDQWSYPQAMEQVSYGRSDSETCRSFCMPTEGSLNITLPFDAVIEIQSTSGTVTASGAVLGESKVSINLQARSASGSLASATCTWEYGDGFVSASCNPPSHTFGEAGMYEVRMAVETACGEAVQQMLMVMVEEARGKGKKGTGTGGPRGVGKPDVVSCVPLTFSGIHISEFLPNPYEDEQIGEWIELVNSSDQPADLCGWSIDDEGGGGKPHALDGETIQPHGLLLLPREQTKIALNNDADSVRLFAPLSSSGAGILVEEVPFTRSVEGESFALRDDGYIVSTPYPTPGEPNRFRSAERRFATDVVVVAAALPNPAGKDGDGEWVELENVSGQMCDLTGWSLDNGEGGSPPFPLDDIRMEPGAVRRFKIQETGITLVNSKDVVRLLDPDRSIVSIFGWTEAVEERVYRRPVITTERASARVVNVVDGDTVDIVLTDPDQFDRLPPPLTRRWLGLAATRSNPSIRVRMIGIDTPETVHPLMAVQKYGSEASNFTKALLQDQEVSLEFETEVSLWDKYDRLLAYIYPVEGDMVQRQLLRHGLAYAYLRFPFLRANEFAALEEEARAARLGLWSDDEVAREMQRIALGVEEEILLEEEGLTVNVQPPSGRVASGTVVTFTPSVTADLYLSVNSGAFIPSSGTYVVMGDVRLAAYAERGHHPISLPPSFAEASEGRPGEGEGEGHAIRSNVIAATYLLERASYDLNVTMSEVYPSPQSGEDEWIELTNLTGHDVQLGGWTLDDTRDGGSRPWIIPGDVVVPGSGSIILTKEQTGLALNNDGDEVWLVSPDGQVAMVGEYGKVKKGRGVIFEACEACEDCEDCNVLVVDDRNEEHSIADASHGEMESEWMAALLWGTQLINIPSVHPRRQREAAEQFLSSLDSPSPMERGEALEEQGGEEDPQIISRVAVVCITDIPTPGAANICRENMKQNVSKKAPKKATKSEQKIYSTVQAALRGMQWLATKYENVFPWISDDENVVELPESHRYLESFIGKVPSYTRHGTSTYPAEPILIFSLLISGLLLFLKGSIRS